MELRDSSLPKAMALPLRLPGLGDTVILLLKQGDNFLREAIQEPLSLSLQDLMAMNGLMKYFLEEPSHILIFGSGRAKFAIGKESDPAGGGRKTCQETAQLPDFKLFLFDQSREMWVTAEVHDDVEGEFACPEVIVSVALTGVCNGILGLDLLYGAGLKDKGRFLRVQEEG